MTSSEDACNTFCIDDLHPPVLAFEPLTGCMEGRSDRLTEHWVYVDSYHEELIGFTLRIVNHGRQKEEREIEFSSREYRQTNAFGSRRSDSIISCSG